MKTKLRFNRADVAALVAALPNDADALTLVKDDGVYLMGFSDPRRLPEGGRVVVYAKGYNPKTDGEDVWEKSRDAMGGDDGGDDIGTKKEMTAILDDSDGDIFVGVSASSLSVSYLPKTPAAPPPLKPFDVFKGSTSGLWRVVLTIRADGKPDLYPTAFRTKGEALTLRKRMRGY
jgi:hypothetical protein